MATVHFASIVKNGHSTDMPSMPSKHVNAGSTAAMTPGMGHTTDAHVTMHGSMSGGTSSPEESLFTEDVR
jgi:hypothetical protein